MGEASSARARRWRGAAFAFGCAAIAGAGFTVGKAAGTETPRSMWLFVLFLAARLPRFARYGARTLATC